MSRIATPLRRATSEDAEHMAELVNIAGDGLPLSIWTKLAKPEQSGWEFGRERAKQGLGGFAFENTVVREEAGEVAACLIGYPKVNFPVPAEENLPLPLVPLEELGKLIPKSSWYLNVLATYPKHRVKGLGTELLQLADLLALDSQHACISLIVSDANSTARRLYEKHGYKERATRPIVKEGWKHEGENWLLMVKEL